jgi:hypothetical protein
MKRRGRARRPTPNDAWVDVAVARILVEQADTRYHLTAREDSGDPPGHGPGVTRPAAVLAARSGLRNIGFAKQLRQPKRRSGVVVQTFRFAPTASLKACATLLERRQG